MPMLLLPKQKMRLPMPKTLPKKPFLMLKMLLPMLRQAQIKPSPTLRKMQIKPYQMQPKPQEKQLKKLPKMQKMLLKML